MNLLLGDNVIEVISLTESPCLMNFMPDLAPVLAA